MESPVCGENQARNGAEYYDEENEEHAVTEQPVLEEFGSFLLPLGLLLGLAVFYNLVFEVVPALFQLLHSQASATSTAHLGEVIQKHIFAD